MEADPVRSLKSIRSKIVVFAILATLVPSLGLGLMSFRHNQGVIDEKVTHELRSLASYARREFDLWIQERVHDVRSLSTSTVVIDGLDAVARRQATDSIGPGSGTPEEIPGLALYLRSVHTRLTPLLELTVVDTSGRIAASSTSAPAPVHLPDVWPQSAITEGVMLEPPRWEAARAAPTLTIAVPVLSIDNEILGALVAVLDLSAVQAQLKGAAELPPGEVILLDAQGRPLVGTPPTTSHAIPLQAEVLQRLHAQPGLPFAFQSFDQRVVLGVADLSHERSVTVLAQKDRAEVYAAWRVLRNQTLMLIGGLSLLVGLLAYQIGRSIVTPLQRLIVAAERIAGGDLAMQLPAARDDEIGRLTRVFNQMTDSLRRGRAEIEAASQTLQQQNQQLERLSVTDSLTGLYNRRKLDEILTDQIARYQRNRRAFSVLMLDIDHFKALNDSHGHLLGDEVLVQVADILAQAIRNVDYAARYGGEEFVIVLVDTSSQAALDTAERIRAKVADASYGAIEQRITVTVSVGVTECREDDATADAVIARADQALYQAKDAGRNRVHPRYARATTRRGRHEPAPACPAALHRARLPCAPDAHAGCNRCARAAQREPETARPPHRARPVRPCGGRPPCR
ncbi:MAG: diguanylate cyclase [Gammaproteobacteria bacterium]|nr:diguanylate cyclase [Gammaproteobacteria bacterium]